MSKESAETLAANDEMKAERHESEAEAHSDKDAKLAKHSKGIADAYRARARYVRSRLDA